MRRDKPSPDPDFIQPPLTSNQFGPLQLQYLQIRDQYMKSVIIGQTNIIIT